MRLVDWYLALNLGQKIVVGIAVPALVFVLTYLASLLILSAAGVGQGGYPPEEGGTPAPASPRPGTSASSPPEFALEIGRASWEGDKAVVEGTWRGDLSSVHCDLLEGGKAGRAIDWWDRSVAAKMSFPKRTFSQAFVRAEGSVKHRIDPGGDYWAVCWAQFSDGLGAGEEAPVEGVPAAG